MEETKQDGANRQPDGTFGPGNCANPIGRAAETQENRAIRKAAKQLIQEYKEALAQCLPQLSPVLINKALSGDVPAIKELHDRVMDKPKQNTDVTSDGKPLFLPSDLLDANNINTKPETDSEGSPSV